MRLPPVIGHRGAAGHAPENTAPSFRKAAELGCSMVEFDVRLSADGVPVVFHDDTLERTTSGHGRVGDTPSTALGALGIATLDEVLALCLSLGLDINIEIKPDAGHERRTTKAAIETARRLWPDDRPAPLVSSFRPEALEDVPDWPCGLLLESIPADWRERAGALGCVALHVDHRALDAGLAARIKGSGLALLAYTVNERERARTLWNWGVDSLFSDFPDRLQAPS